MLSQRKIWSAVALLGLVVASATAAPLPEPRAVTADDSKWLLPDAEMFFKLNIKQMLSSDLMTKSGGLEKLKEGIKQDAKLKGFLDATGIDVTKDVDTILMTALGTSAKDAKALIVVRGNFDTTKIHDAIEKAAKNEGKLKISKEGTTRLYEITAGDNPLFAAFVDKNTAVMTTSKESTLDAVKNGGKKAATISKGMQSALSKFTGKESLALALVVNEELKKHLADIPQAGAAAAQLQTFTVSVTLTDEVVFGLAGNTGEPKSAKQLADIVEKFKGVGALALGGMQGLPAVAGDVLNAVKVTATKEAVKVDLKVTKDMIDKVNKAGDK